MQLPVGAWNYHGKGGVFAWADLRAAATSGTVNQTLAKIKSSNNGGGSYTINRVLMGWDLTPFGSVIQALLKVTDIAGDLTPTRIHVSDVTPQSVVTADASANFRKMYDAYGADPIGAMSLVSGLVHQRDVTAWWNAHVGGWAWLGLVETDYDKAGTTPGVSTHQCLIEKPGDTGYPFLEYSAGPGIIGDGIMP
ncbi:hypothetical protein LCGC14_1475690 [marine sediment metagenome]|uniref:Uncharacterized protein n=1 Tax=marine sediment metagenome TaxID=412755 RepID=A0A0F9JBR2_9ZZZZ